jgi:hypothetical protein
MRIIVYSLIALVLPGLLFAQLPNNQPTKNNRTIAKVVGDKRDKTM